MTLSEPWRNAPLHVLPWGMADKSEQSNITLVRSFFTAWGVGRPTDLRSAYETFLSEDCRYGERLKDRDAMLRWLLSAMPRGIPNQTKHPRRHRDVSSWL